MNSRTKPYNTVDGTSSSSSLSGNSSGSITDAGSTSNGGNNSKIIDENTASAGAVFAGLSIVSSITAARALSMLCRRLGMFQNEFVSA